VKRKTDNIIPRLCWPLLLLCGSVLGAEEDWDDGLETGTDQVNEGELHILAEPPARPVHHHQNRIRIHDDSLEHGWVTLEQCHEQLDPVPATQIVYHGERIRGLTILNAAGIGDARVQGASIQLQDVQRGARLCLRADSRALWTLPDGCRQLRNGPYMRRFLDGFYPMRLSLEVNYPEAFQLRRLDPPARPGVQLQQAPGHLSLSLYFEGRLHTAVTLCPEPAQD